MSKKTIFINYGTHFLLNPNDYIHGSYNTKEDFFVHQILREKYHVVISENPDYVIVCEYEHGYDYSYIDENSILIQIRAEALAPHFTLCDYAIGFDDIFFCDRYLKWNYFLQYHPEYDEKPTISENLSNRKFCSFMASDSNADVRQLFFEKLSEQYKQVASGGRVRNNIGRMIPQGREAKLEFLHEYKFHLAFENALYRGYTTEKIADAFCAHTIPIYWGNPDVAEYYNPDSFINCHDYANFEAVIERIKELDEDPVSYMKMLRTPPTSRQITDTHFQKLREFLFHIFDQPLDKARRRGVGTAHRNTLGHFKTQVHLQSQVHHLRNSRWYRFGQLSRKRKLWTIAKILSKKLRVYTLLRPAAKFIGRILRKA